MGVATARALQTRTLDEARWGSDDAVLLLWQADYETPLIPGADRRTALRLEKAVERLAMLPVDFATAPGEHCLTPTNRGSHRWSTRSANPSESSATASPLRLPTQPCTRPTPATSCATSPTSSWPAANRRAGIVASEEETRIIPDEYRSGGVHLHGPAGTLLVFNSDIVHSATHITKGERLVIRSRCIEPRHLEAGRRQRAAAAPPSTPR